MKSHARTTYLALVHKDGESAFGLTFPDIPGCFSAADAEIEILANAMEAIELWAEDAPSMPAPRGIEDIRKDAETAKELANGAYLIAVPLIRNTGKSTRVNITLPGGLLDAIDEEAVRRKMTRSAFLAQAAEREIGG